MVCQFTSLEKSSDINLRILKRCTSYWAAQMYWRFFSSHLLLMIRDDASDKVRVGVSESGHQICQLLFVQLSYCTKHSLTRLDRSMQGFSHSSHFVQSHNSVHWWKQWRKKHIMQETNTSVKTTSHVYLWSLLVSRVNISRPPAYYTLAKPDSLYSMTT